MFKIDLKSNQKEKKQILNYLKDLKQSRKI